MKNLVMLDFGSNSTRMSITQIAPDGSFKEVKRAKEMTRLAEGMGQSDGQKILQPQAIQRTLGALLKFKKLYRDLPNVSVRGIATAAVREAQNQSEFLQQVKEVTNIDVEVLSGSSEAYYDYLAVINTLTVKDCVICDMGGGSFELVVVKDRKAMNYISIPYGAVSLTEKFHAADKISARDFFSFSRFLNYKFHQLPWLKEGKGLPLVLLGGANRTVARQELLRSGKDEFKQIHGLKLSTYMFLEIYTDWLGKDVMQRKAILGSEAPRADIIIGGLTPVAFLLEYLQIPEVIFSESGVREGVLYSMLQK